MKERVLKDYFFFTTSPHHISSQHYTMVPTLGSFVLLLGPSDAMCCVNVMDVVRK